MIAQALLLGSTPEYATADIEIVRGSVSQKTADRFSDLFLQGLEVRLAAEHVEELSPHGTVYLDGSLYGGLPQLYPLDAEELEDPTRALIADYERLFDACAAGRILISVAKSSRDSILGELLQVEAGLPPEEQVRIPDSELITRWTEDRCGYSTPVLLGRRSFKGWPSETLLDPSCAVTQMPSVLVFFIRPEEFGPLLRVDVPARCIGREERIVDIDACLGDLRDVKRPLARILADYQGPRVYNPLLYAVDDQVALHADRFQEVYLPMVEAILEVRFDPSVSQGRFLSR